MNWIVSVFVVEILLEYVHSQVYFLYARLVWLYKTVIVIKRDKC